MLVATVGVNSTPTGRRRKLHAGIFIRKNNNNNNTCSSVLLNIKTICFALKTNAFMKRLHSDALHRVVSCVLCVVCCKLCAAQIVNADVFFSMSHFNQLETK